MFRNLVLSRPLAVIDLETTGIKTDTDRIVEVSVLKVCPDGKRVHHTRRLNPGIPIPPEATAIHKITDADVANEKAFAEIAEPLARFLDGCDFCGYNLKKFDLQMLYCEFRRAGVSWSLDDRAIVDAMEIFHHFERRDLSNAVRFYLGKEHAGAHGAAADVLATAGILDAMFEKHSELPRDVAKLHQHFIDPNAIDSVGKFIRVEGEVRFTFGKYRGQPLSTVAAENPDYLQWILRGDFFEDAKALVRDALEKVNSKA